MKYMTIKQAADRWNVSIRRVQQLCKNGLIDGVIKSNGSWLIPSDAIVHLRNSIEHESFLPLPVGVSGYIETVSNYYYVDKTLMIKDIIDNLPKVSLFTRPRRFGKTLNMDMLKVFFEKSDIDNSIYFKNKQIWLCGSKYQEYQGKYPVVYLSFKDVKHNNWKDCFDDIADNLMLEFGRHIELLDSDKCNAMEKREYRKVLESSCNEVELSKSLLLISMMLNKHYGEKCVIIIDEYDTPIEEAYLCGYYDEIIGFIRNLFSSAFKDNSYLAFGFMSGILRVGKESIFSGLNNLKINSIMDEKYSSYFGFTKEEIEEMLKYYGKEEKMDEIIEWYDGYNFGNSAIFNPWSVINYVDNNCNPKAFWVSSGNNEIIKEVISDSDNKTKENLRRMLQKEEILVNIDTNIIYPEIKNRPDTIYSFLLMAGYLKNTMIDADYDGNYMCKLSIPNKEIAFAYAKEIISMIRPYEAESTAILIKQAIYEKDIDKFRSYLNDYLYSTISYHDASSEAFYQGMMIGLCAIFNNEYTVKSNRESGLGRFDIALYPINKDLPGYIFEIKRCENGDLEDLAYKALKQINDKDYISDMKEKGIKEVVKAGIAFRGKEVKIINN